MFKKFILVLVLSFSLGVLAVQPNQGHDIAARNSAFFPRAAPCKSPEGNVALTDIQVSAPTVLLLLAELGLLRLPSAPSVVPSPLRSPLASLLLTATGMTLVPKAQSTLATPPSSSPARSSPVAGLTSRQLLVQS